MSNFNASYSRRPARAPAPPPLSSLLGEPPVQRSGSGRSQQQGQHYGNYGVESSSFRQEKSKFEEEYDNMMDEFGEYHKKESNTGMSSQRDVESSMDFDDREGSSRWSHQSPPSGRMQQEFSHRGDTEPSGRRPTSSWTTKSNQRDYDDDSNRMGNSGQMNQQQFMQSSKQQFSLQNQNQGLGLNNPFGQLSQQPQSLLNLNTGLMGMMPAQNALNLLQQQQQLAAAAANPMQLLLGNLPAFSSEALGKQILNAAAAAASGGTPFGQGLGLGSQMPPPLMGIRTQDNSYDKRSFDRNSNRSRSARQRSPLNSSRRDLNRPRDTGRSNDRVDRKRGGDRFDDSDQKRSRGREDNKGRVLRTSISSPGRGRNSGGGQRKDGNRSGRKSDSNKDKSSGKTKEETKDSSKSKKDEIEKNGSKKEAEDVTAEIDTSVERKDEDKSERRSKYDDFPSSLLVCKVCQKSMNDGSSFESHLNGRAHMALLDILKERFIKRADLLMAESRLAEEETSIELDRQKRAGKGQGSGHKSKNHCKMCDCSYTMSWGSHKSGIHHRILKEFLHPTCRICDAQFVHRMDWVNHIYSTAHLRKLAELKDAGKDLEEHETTKQGELFALSIEIGQDEQPSNCITVRNLDWKVPLKEDLKELLKDDLDLPEDEIIIPENYDDDVAVGGEAIVTTTGYCCKVCKVYFTQESQVEPHLKNKSHFGMYTAFLRKVVRYRKHLHDEETETENQETAHHNDEEVINDEENEGEGDDDNEADGEGHIEDENEEGVDEDKDIEMRDENENQSEEKQIDVPETKVESNEDQNEHDSKTEIDTEVVEANDSATVQIGNGSEIETKASGEPAIQIVDVEMESKNDEKDVEIVEKAKSPEPIMLKPLPPKSVRARGRGPVPTRGVGLAGRGTTPSAVRGGSKGGGITPRGASTPSRAGTRGGHARGARGGR